jgi:hypothetical protein
MTARPGTSAGQAREPVILGDRWAIDGRSSGDGARYGWTTTVWTTWSYSK